MNKVLSVVCMTALLTLSTIVSAQEAEMPQMSEEQQALMERFTAYMTPNENHDTFKQLTGTWTAKIMHWMSPETEPETSIGTSVGTMTMNGKFLEQNFSGDWQGQPFVGRGIYGYDNIQQKFTGIWYDNMGTGIMYSNGDFNADSNTLSESGKVSCPITNGLRDYRGVTTIIDENNYTYETYMTDESGNEFRSMLIEYTREG